MIAEMSAFLRNEAGATSIEYALLATFIAVTIVGVCTGMFTKLSGEYSEISAAFS
jgi:pilus assembly protein Flp/PilA